MTTNAALRALPDSDRQVFSPPQLLARGISRSQLTANLAANRWQRVGGAVVLHRGALTRDERWRAALINAGRSCVLTAFTAAELLGLEGWKRDEIHVLGPRGAVLASDHGLSIRLHRTRHWPPRQAGSRPCQALPDALVVAAGTFAQTRPACGLLAAAVQQRLVSVPALRSALDASPRVRHRGELRLAVADIAGGADALSEIDFVRLCRKAGLPPPEQQQVRIDSAGRRRYVDASWRRADGRVVVVEIDGALHLSPRRWWDDQLRQNELVLGEALVLRFPSVMVRAEEATVMRQVRRALRLS